jgi:hypothetical protein
MYLLGIIVLAVAFFWALGRFSRSNPASMAKLVRRIAGVALVAAGGFLTLRGLAVVGAPIVAFGLGMLGMPYVAGMNFPGRGRKPPPGQVSRVHTKLFAMELDHDSGSMDGVVLAGDMKGERLSGMSLAQVLSLAPLAQQMGDRSAALLQAYLDRVHPEWQAQAGGERAEVPVNGMSRTEAYIILGLAPGAGESEIKAAHRKLMKQHHPDRGGNAEHAARINAAKELLIG